MSGLDIVHQDAAIVVVNKPGGLLAVPGRGPDKQDCIVNRVKALIPDCLEQPSVHRLDMDTSGLMVLALNATSQRHLAKQFENRQVQKTYVAILQGIVDTDAGEIELAFRLDPENRPHQVYDPIQGKTGLTRWRKLGVENGCTRVEFEPVTGRTHQLRLHAASEHGLGCPIVGDRLYGTGTEPGQLRLHAVYLSFVHPETGLQVEFRSNPGF
jgi:tRNA pseudouridine32 synthase/23S rRNA pseudouridine746 synthase